MHDGKNFRTFTKTYQDAKTYAGEMVPVFIPDGETFVDMAEAVIPPNQPGRRSRRGKVKAGVYYNKIAPFYDVLVAGTCAQLKPDGTCAAYGQENFPDPCQAIAAHVNTIPVESIQHTDPPKRAVKPYVFGRISSVLRRK